MKKYVYNSILKDEIYEFFDLRANQGYRDDVRYILLTLDEFLTGIGLAEKILTPISVESWIKSLSGRMSINTKIVYVSHYRQFAKYLQSVGIPAFIHERPKGESSYVPYIFTQEELIRIFEAADNLTEISDSYLPTCIQFPIVLRILYGCGMRLGEVLSLKIPDLDFEREAITVRGAKGNMDRLVPMDTSLTAICRKYYEIIGMNSSNDSYLFPTNRKGKHTHAWARKCFGKVLLSAKISKFNLPRYSRNICIHCLRHTFAVNSFGKQNGMGIDNYAAAPLLSAYMGHKNPTGTELYLRMSAENSSDIISKMNSYTSNIFPEVPE